MQPIQTDPPLQYRVMVTYTKDGEIIDECVATYNNYSSAWTLAQRLQSKWWSVWIQKRHI